MSEWSDFLSEWSDFLSERNLSDHKFWHFSTQTSHNPTIQYAIFFEFYSLTNPFR